MAVIASHACREHRSAVSVGAGALLVETPGRPLLETCNSIASDSRFSEPVTRSTELLARHYISMAIRDCSHGRCARCVMNPLRRSRSSMRVVRTEAARNGRPVRAGRKRQRAQLSAMCWRCVACTAPTLMRVDVSCMWRVQMKRLRENLPRSDDEAAMRENEQVRAALVACCNSRHVDA